MEGIGFSRAYRFNSVDDGPRIAGTVFKRPGSREAWIAMVDDSTIKVFMAGRDIAAREAIRQARLPTSERTPPSISGEI